MSKYEILVLILLAVIFSIIFVTYLFHGRKLTKKNKEAKAKPEKVEEKPVEKPIEQKPVAVGIIKSEQPKVEKENIVDDIAPFKEQPKVENVTLKEDKKQTIQDEIKNLSPEMKKVIMSDILKPRF